jgi:hypothetical protein
MGFQCIINGFDTYMLMNVLKLLKINHFYCFRLLHAFNVEGIHFS